MVEEGLISTVMLMAAGLGTRMRPFTNERNKVLLPVMGIPIAQYVVDSLVRAGVNKIVANIHHHPHETHDGLLNLEHDGAQILISDESELLRGSAGGMRKASEILGNQPFFYANADVLCDVNWSALARCHLRLRRRWGVCVTLAIFSSAENNGQYREILFNPEEGLIKGLGPLSIHKPLFIGAAVLEPETVAQLPAEGPSDFVKDILEPAIKTHRAGVYFGNGLWFDIGSPALWLDTHVQLIQRLEKGYFKNAYGINWRDRIESRNRRVSEGIWVSKGSPRSSKMNRWIGPAYWEGNLQVKKNIPEVLGPAGVLYGTSEQANLSHGIGIDGYWVKS